VNEVSAGDQLTARIADGAFSSRVESVTPNQPQAKRSRKARP
jgi:hypothetical protein